MDKRDIEALRRARASVGAALDSYGFTILPGDEKYWIGVLRDAFSELYRATEPFTRLEDSPMGEWIVIIATVASAYNLAYANTTYTPNLDGLYGTISSPPTPTITVVRAKTREEAEAQAIGYYVNETGTAMWSDEKIIIKGLYPNESRSNVVIAPDGKVYSVTRSEKKKKVTRVVEESDGWETKWEPRP